MANYLDALLARIADTTLAADIADEVARLRDRKQFGLVFEKHLPERVRLHGHPIRQGVQVQRLTDNDGPAWVVTRIVKGRAKLARRENNTTVVDEQPLNDLVVVREFGQPIYPGLESVHRVQKGEEKPFHTVINAENYHALETLLYAYEGQVDCIYIDPPYNTGAKDWKYNNNYVDDNDQFRHSKWLSFMERRLRLAKRLLNPAKSFLIVTIDEKEYLRLGLLLEQIFPGNRIQMVSSQISPSGSARGKEFYRVDEYLFFVYVGDAQVNDVPFIEGLCVAPQNESQEVPEVRWESLLRSGSGAKRSESHLKFYPVYVDPRAAQIVKVGEHLPLGKHPADVRVPRGVVAVWPMRQDGSEGRWQLSRRSFLKLQESGHVKIGKIHKGTGEKGVGKITLKYLPTGLRAKIARGEIVVTGKDEYGGLELAFAGFSALSGRPKTQWCRSEHSAADHGSSLLRRLIPGRKFPYPKSLYAVEDTLRFAVGDNRKALVLDFFAGSGTTTHAVMRLNEQDGGHRRSICVTNNEVSSEEQEVLAAQGLRPGDKAWESQGIFQHITLPRVAAAVSGRGQDGESLQGAYSAGAYGREASPLSNGYAENVEFFTLTYQDRDCVSLGKAFEAIAPLLWLKAGGRGGRIDTLPKRRTWAIPDQGQYGVLFDPQRWREFVDAVAKSPAVSHVFVVTDSIAVFQQVLAELPNGVEATMLYEDYLSTFEINTGNGVE